MEIVGRTGNNAHSGQYWSYAHFRSGPSVAGESEQSYAIASVNWIRRSRSTSDWAPGSEDNSPLNFSALVFSSSAPHKRKKKKKNGRLCLIGHPVLFFRLTSSKVNGMGQDVQLPRPDADDVETADPPKSDPIHAQQARQHKTHPHERSLWNVVNAFSRLCYIWLSPHVANAARAEVHLDSFPEVPWFDKSQRLTQLLREHWQQLSKRAKVGEAKSEFWAALRATYLKLFLWTTLFLSIEIAGQLLQAFFLGNIVLFLQNDAAGLPVDEPNAYWNAFALSLCAIV